MFTLKDSLTQKCLPRPVHTDRLKTAFVRKPNPSKYFMDTVQSKVSDQNVSISESGSLNEETSIQESVSVDESNSDAKHSTALNETAHDSHVRRSERNVRKLARYRDSLFTDNPSETDNSVQFKVKRVLAKK